MIETGKALGVDYNIGLRLKSLVEENGFTQNSQEEHQSKLPPETAREFLTMVHQEWAKKALDEGMVSQDLYQTWEEEIEGINSPFLFAKMIYLTAHKISDQSD